MPFINLDFQNSEMIDKYVKDRYEMTPKMSAMQTKIYVYMLLNLLEYASSFMFLLLSIFAFDKFHNGRKNKYLKIFMTS